MSYSDKDEYRNPRYITRFPRRSFPAASVTKCHLRPSPFALPSPSHALAKESTAPSLLHILGAMADAVKIELLPLGKVLVVDPGTPLQDVLFDEGVEFPCGGKGRCKGCRIRILSDAPHWTEDEAALLTPEELRSGWRLACRCQADRPLRIDLAQWEGSILAGEGALNLKPAQGLGVAIDLGTTTLVAQLLDLHTGNVLAVQTAFNAQAAHGADIMSRIDVAIAGGAAKLTTLIRQQLSSLIQALLQESQRSADDLTNVVIVGNTVMHHLFCGISVEPLSHYPFEPAADGLQQFTASDLGWPFPATIRFLPCLGGFVGSDILAGIVATGMHQYPELTALIDLGTNGEIVVGQRGRFLCASAAAGPAFEGARISMGMRAATGAISEAAWKDGQWHCRVLGNVPPRGICGSGLVDAVAGALDLGMVQPSGKLTAGSTLALASPVALNQRDIRELQLAKGAIAAAIRILLEKLGASSDDLTRVYLAGAFGNYISRASARRIGLLHFPLERVEPAGNTALHGAKLALVNLPESDTANERIRATVDHLSLSDNERFQDIFVDEMQFPS